MAALIVSTAEADTYFSKRLHTEVWDDLASNEEEKTAALMTAQIILDNQFVLDATNDRHTNAICEQTLFMLIAGEGYEHRAALLAFGVSKSDALLEEYLATNFIGICAYAVQALKAARRSEASVTVRSRRATRDDTDYVQ